MSPPRKATIRRLNRHSWILEPLEENPAYLTRPMFGCTAAYYNGRLVLVLADKDEPWRGLLVPTEKDAHAQLIALFPALRPHPVLPKWLYLPEAAVSFERDAGAVVERVRQCDPLIGVLPAARKRARKETSRKRKSPK